MRKIPFNDTWTFWKVGCEENKQTVSLPHDAMLAEERTATSMGGANISFFEGGDYVYEKIFDYQAGTGKCGICAEPGSRVVIEFEGVYRNAEVYLNERKLAMRPYGYTNFYVELTDHLLQGENSLRLIAFNSQQPNSRWYTGSGIYRPVNLYILPKQHILLNGVKIKTTDYVNPTVDVSINTNGEGRVKVEITKKGQEKVLYSAEGDTDGSLKLTVPMPGAALWSNETPNLYTCCVSFEGDHEEVNFGVRMVECTVEKGFCINGKRVILRGACIHHDNGVIGAVAEPYAEERKIRLLQKVGYNAIRSAHNPCSKALLDACDESGMLVLDEYIDMWYIHKTKYDYTDYFDTWWQQDLADMVDKDYNHPSVIMYSIGNEVAETSQKRGIDLTKQMTEHLHSLDETRKVTCGVNIFFNYLFSMGFGVYSDKKADQQAKEAKVKSSVGSEFYNNIAGIMGASFMKTGATLHGSNVKTRDAFANMDVAGYNYGIKRYRGDLVHYPNRIILGTETFCADTYTFWEMAKKHPALIGDFVWAGMDYLGEAGIGAWEYKDYAPDFNHGVGWLTAGSGRMDITGRSGGEALYTRVAFELDDIHMAVVPVMEHKQQHSPSAWKLTNAIPSWSFSGLEGADATVEVYSRAYKVALFVNGTKVGEKKRGNNCRFIFKTKYHDGKLEAKAYDETGKQIAQTSLQTAGKATKLTLLPEEKSIGKDDLCYVRIRYTDDKGEIKPLTRGVVKVSVENGVLLGMGNGCSYNHDGYLNEFTDTYYGEALAVIRPTGSGDVRVKAASPYGDANVAVTVR